MPQTITNEKDQWQDGQNEDERTITTLKNSGAEGAEGWFALRPRFGNESPYAHCSMMTKDEYKLK